MMKSVNGGLYALGNEQDIDYKAHEPLGEVSEPRRLGTEI